MVKIAVVGAGIAGLVCARRLQQAGYWVQILEKSRGLGGRVATRRLPSTCADHGLRYLENQGKWTQRLIPLLLRQDVIQPWEASVYQWLAGELTPMPAIDRFTASEGITAMAKWLGAGLEILRSQRVVAIAPQPDRTWTLTLEIETGTTTITGFAAIGLAIPAPQAVDLVTPLTAHGLPSEFLANLRAIEFDPCLTVIAQYAPDRAADFAALPARAVQFTDSTLAWLSLEHSKRASPQMVVVIHSTAAFAQPVLEASEASVLSQVGQQLLQAATEALKVDFCNPEALQVHRWRYAFPQSAGQGCRATKLPLPLVCWGDWCGSDRLESALHFGIAAAEQINQWFTSVPLPPVEW